MFANDRTLCERLGALVAQEGVVAIVVGMPYAPDGGKGVKGQEVEEFIAELRRHTPVTVTTWDESSTSVDAVRAMIASGLGRKRRREKGRTDEMAACLILQEYLDAAARSTQTP